MLFRLHATILLVSLAAVSFAQSSSAKHVKKPAVPILEIGSTTNNVYHNRMLGLTCKVPEGWVLRTDELNARDSEKPNPEPGSQVLLAAFSRPPQAQGEDVNSSILIAAEPQSAYPGLKEAVQYFGPLTEVAKAQGFTQDEEPYEFTAGAKGLVREDFHKDVGTRVMLQSTLAMLSHGYAVSITVIAGTEEEVAELIDSITVSSLAK